jgi:hypothetical protein
MSNPRESELPAAPCGRTVLAAQATLRPAAEDAARARELAWPGVHVEMLVPVIAGGVKRIVDAPPRGAFGFLKKDAHVPTLVGDLRSSAELLGDGGQQLVGDGGQQLVGAPSRARHMDHDHGQRHKSRA